MTYERFTERARQVVVLAQAEAREHHHREVTVDHLVVGLLAESESLAAQVLTGLGLTLDMARHQLAPEREQVVSPEDPPLQGAAKVSLETALREALSLGHNYIGTEHILLGLLREPAGAHALRWAGNSNRIRAAVLERLSGPGTGKPYSWGGGHAKQEPKPTKPDFSRALLRVTLQTAQYAIKAALEVLE